MRQQRERVRGGRGGDWRLLVLVLEPCLLVLACLLVCLDAAATVAAAACFLSWVWGLWGVFNSVRFHSSFCCDLAAAGGEMMVDVMYLVERGEDHGWEGRGRGVCACMCVCLSV